MPPRRTFEFNIRNSLSGAGLLHSRDRLENIAKIAHDTRGRLSEQEATTTEHKIALLKEMLSMVLSDVEMGHDQVHAQGSAEVEFSEYGEDVEGAPFSPLSMPAPFDPSVSRLVRYPST